MLLGQPLNGAKAELRRDGLREKCAPFYSYKFLVLIE